MEVGDGLIGETLNRPIFDVTNGICNGMRSPEDFEQVYCISPVSLLFGYSQCIWNLQRSVGWQDERNRYAVA